MAAAGLPVYRSDHAEALCGLALKMVEAVGSFTVDGTPLVAKCGIHTGNCIAGVIGQSLPRYRLFGDTINSAVSEFAGRAMAPRRTARRD